MTGQQLHDYDRRLCKYAFENIGQYLHDRQFARAAREELEPQLLDYLAEDPDPAVDREWLLLSSAEFCSLEAAFDADIYELDRAWVADELLHRRRVECVREVRDELTRQDAEDWSRASAGFAARLERKSLRLGQGIAIVHEWALYLRRLLQAMGAADLLPYPEGRLPTPTNPTPPAVPAPPARPSAVARKRTSRGCAG
jgi:hypothetical protein